MQSGTPGFRTPWDQEAEATVSVVLPAAPPPPKRRGRRPLAQTVTTGTTPSPGWLYHHLTVSGPAAALAEFSVAARGSGVIPWQLDYDAIEEDVFNLAAAQPPDRRSLTIEGCRILARQFRDRVAARQRRAALLAGQSLASPFDLHQLLPIPDAILQLGPGDPVSLVWLAQYWGTTDGLRRVVSRDPAAIGRLAAGHAAVGYGFFTTGDTLQAAIGQLSAAWPALRFRLQPRPG